MYLHDASQYREPSRHPTNDLIRAETQWIASRSRLKRPVFLRAAQLYGATTRNLAFGRYEARSGFGVRPTIRLQGALERPQRALRHDANQDQR